MAASAWTDSNVQNVVRRRVVRAEPPEHGRGKAEAGAEMDGALTNDAQAHANDAHCLTLAADAQGVLQLASLLGLHAVGPEANKRVRRVQVLGGKEYALPERCATVEGYNLHANVSLRASDRAGLERLCRYVLRPPLALPRLERLPDGRVRVGMKRVFSDGTGAIDLTPLEFVAKLAAIIPPPRANQVVYSGVLAGNAAWRPEVVPKVPTSTEAERAERAALKLVKAEHRRATSERAGQAPCWAELLRRVFRVDGWECPHCAKPMKLRSIVIREPATTRVLSGLLRSTGPPAEA